MGANKSGPSNKKVILLSCSGGANVGEIADEAARRAMFAGRGEMYCLAGVGSHQEEFVKKTHDADRVVVVDGCDEECGRNMMERCGLGGYQYVRIIDLGIQKAKPKRAENEQVEAVTERIEALL